MKPVRRQFLRLAMGAVAIPAISRMARAESYPARPVRIVVGFPAGGPVDITARLMGQWLGERLGQPFIVENRPGAGSNIGTEVVVRSPADGYTLLLVAPANMVNATLYEKLDYNFIRDIAPVSAILRAVYIMEVHPTFAVKTVPDFIAYAKANPGKVNFASAGNGTVQHVAGELFKYMTGIDMVHVPYRGVAPALNDLLGGQVSLMFDNMLTSLAHLKAGKLRALAVTTEKRSELLPEIPAIAESVPGYEASGLFGLGVPSGTSPDIIDKLNREVAAALADPRMKARITDSGAVPMPTTPTEFGKQIAEETDKFGKVVKLSGAKPG